MRETISAVVLGASGYVGGELLRLIAAHPGMELAAAVSESSAGKPVASAFPHLSRALDGHAFTAPWEWLDALTPGSRLALFSAAPHGASASVIAAAIEVGRQRHRNARRRLLG